MRRINRQLWPNFVAHDAEEAMEEFGLSHFCYMTLIQPKEEKKKKKKTTTRNIPDAYFGKSAYISERVSQLFPQKK